MSEEQVYQAKKNIRLLLIAVPLLLLLMAGSIFFMFPVGQKLLGKSLVVASASGYEIIYKGQTLMLAPSNCVVHYTDDFSQIDVTCKDGSHDTWVNGELVKTHTSISESDQRKAETASQNTEMQKRLGSIDTNIDEILKQVEKSKKK